jgi:hypothetical protein
MTGLGGVLSNSVSWRIDYEYTEKGKTSKATHIVSARSKKQAEKIGLWQIRQEHPNATSILYQFPKRA